MMEWKPIKTAPLCKFILVSRRGQPDSAMAAMQVERGQFFTGLSMYRDATDWMELPKAPEAA